MNWDILFIRCDDGYFGSTCLPAHKLKKKSKIPLDKEEELWADDIKTVGGSIMEEVAVGGGKHGCGVLSSGGNLYFNKVK